MYGGVTRGLAKMSNSLEQRSLDDSSTIENSNSGNGAVPSEDKRHYRL